MMINSLMSPQRVIASHKIGIERIFQVILMCGLVSSITLLGIVSYWLYWPIEVLVVNQPIKIVTPVVKLPGELVYELNYCKGARYQDNYALVQHTLSDGLIYNLSNSSGPLAFGCQIVHVALELPRLPAGIYSLEMTRTYAVNPLRHIVVRSKSLPFAVTN